ncbi:RNA polymerase sigma factor [Halioxenophilus sp. WMMB6]|uniref:RNA polymerase sigma factor n=1 Tax=Halioxenophilus sp. WMMB6 TaxID=3073815 RepID=UPI00295E4252|nr:RNA polymerase sigma factor [Halioxenophilus sp. WMMB6]
MSPPSELDAWLRAAQKGDQAAFAQVFDHCYGTMYRYALKWSGNVADAEDITQVASIKLAKSIGQFQFDAAFTTWLYRLVVNTAIDWQRSNQRHHPVAQAETIEPETGDSQAGFNGVLLQQLIARVAELGEGFREAVILVLGEGFSHREAAEVLAVQESTISWRIHQVRKVLTEQLGGDHE